MGNTRLNGKLFSSLIVGGAYNLHENMEIVNDLNVFPIPDGDTGENMYLTMSGGVKSLKNVDEISLSKISQLVADGMLLSARGNSGVILSQFFAGIAKGFANIDEANLVEVSNALQEGVSVAYSAVINPTEGTILTVAREASSKVNQSLNKITSLEELLLVFINEAKESLKRTPDLLDVLKEANVVDSGGSGLIYIFDGMYHTLTGEMTYNNESLDNQNVKQEIDFSKFNENSVMEFAYCTEFLLQLQKCKIDINKFDINELIAYLETKGDSIVAFKTGSIVKVHVHTLDPGTVLHHVQQYGEFLTVKIENMTLQHNEVIKKEEQKAKKEKKKYATIAIATGKGIISTFKDLGADYIVEGGQCHNPSTEDFIDAFNEVNAENIFVLPNNSNILLAAKQAASLYKDSNVYVIESKNIGQGYSALSMLNYDFDNIDEIIENFNESIKDVTFGQVTSSVRDANINDVEIKKGNYIGFSDKLMLSSSNDKIETTMKLLEKLDLKNHEVLIAIFGEDVSEEEKNIFRNNISNDYRNCELYEIEGQQDLYDFLLIVS